MQKTPRGLRLQIGIFGRRNVGKSSILNSLTSQYVSIVSDVAGTTTDPVEKAMELHPVGPVLFVDTAGIDESGTLGKLRVEKTKAVLDRVDIAILVTDEWERYEDELIDVFRQRNTPVLVVANKRDLRNNRDLEETALRKGLKCVVSTTANSGEGLPKLLKQLIEQVPEEFIKAPPIVSDLVTPGELVVLVVPIDSAAPKGRLILPQVQTLREILDSDSIALVVKEKELADALDRLKRPPALVITDSQAFLKVSADTPSEIPLTSFSILFSRFKGDLMTSVRGALKIELLEPGNRILIAEACTHHATGEDIGRIKLPGWLEQYIGGKVEVDVFSGSDFPDTLASYDLVIHCGACVANRRLMLTRIALAKQAGVPMTNYGMAIAYSLGIFERALKPFPSAYEEYLEMKEGQTA